MLIRPPTDVQHATPIVSMGPWPAPDEPKSIFNINDVDFGVILETSLHEKCGKHIHAKLDA